MTTRAARGGWTSVSATGNHTCATRIGGSLWCWGDNAGGDLGIGNGYRPGRAAAGHHPGRERLGQRHHRRVPHLRHPHRRHPVVLGRQLVRPARPGQPRPARTCRSRSPPRRRRAGSASTAGATTPARPAPMAPCGAGASNRQRPARPRATRPSRTCRSRSAPRRAAGWASVTGGYRHTCATRTRRHPVVLGLQQLRPARHRQLTPTRTCRSRSPSRGWKAGAAVQAKGQNSCALRPGGTLWCWGSDIDGELGIGGGHNKNRPQQVTGSG